MSELSEGNYFFLTHCEVWQHLLWRSCCLWYSQINMFDLCTVALQNRKNTADDLLWNEEFHFVSWGLMLAAKIYLLLLLLYFPIISNCKTQPINRSQCKTTSDDYSGNTHLCIQLANLTYGMLVKGDLAFFPLMSLRTMYKNPIIDRCVLNCPHEGNDSKATYGTTFVVLYDVISDTQLWL